MGAINAGVILAYLLLIMAVGLGAARRHRGTSGYFVGGRKIPWWAAGLSIFATVLSSITFMSIPAKTYVTDWVYIATNIPILLLAPLVVTCYLPFFRQLNVVSAYEYLEKRFNLAVRLFGSASYVLAQCARMAIILYLPALALATVSSINVQWCIIIAGLVAVAYTTIGGIEAAIWADVVQAVVLIGAALLCLAVALRSGGSVAEAWQVARADHKLTLLDWSWSASLPSTGLLFAGATFAHLISYTADQTVVQRYLTTSDEKQAAKAIWTNALLAVPVSIVFFSLGTAIYVFYKAHPSQLEPALTNDGILPYFIMQHLPVGLAGLAIAGIFACSQSSVSSSLNSVSTALVTDFYRRLNPGLTDAACLKMARRLTLLTGVFVIGVALLMASFDIRSVWDLFAMFVGLIGSSLAGFFALGIFTRRANGPGALTGAAIGLATLITIRLRTDVHFFLYALIGVLTCFASGWIASLLLRAEPRNLDRLTWYTRRGHDPNRRKDGI